MQENQTGWQETIYLALSQRRSHQTCDDASRETYRIFRKQSNRLSSQRVGSPARL